MHALSKGMNGLLQQEKNMAKKAIRNRVEQRLHAAEISSWKKGGAIIQQPDPKKQHVRLQIQYLKELREAAI